MGFYIIRLTVFSVYKAQDIKVSEVYREKTVKLETKSRITKEVQFCFSCNENATNSLFNSCLSMKAVSEPSKSVNIGCKPQGGEVLPYMAYTGMCRWTGYGFRPLCPKQGI